jgi:hypothetical protein
MKVYQFWNDGKRLFVETGIERAPLKGDYYNFRGVAGGGAKENWSSGYYTQILRPIRFYELLYYKLTQWADRHINWPAVGFWITILFSAACWYGVFRLIWWVWYGA